MAVLTLTTDFGTSDGYVGTMKGVILSIAPQARLVDLSHAIPAHGVRSAAYVLYAAAPFFPEGAVHLVVVDPGVGTQRRALAFRTSRATFVGPDNGLFTYVLMEAGRWQVVELNNPAYHLEHVSATFHGRDVFAPAAAHLAAGVPLEDLGSPVTNPLFLPPPRLEVGWEELVGEVLHVDRFGNLITSIGRLHWERRQVKLTPAFQAESVPRASFPPGRVQVEIAGMRLQGLHRTYGAVEVDQPLALVGSGGFLEIGVREGSAAERLGAKRGDPVIVHFR